LEGLQNDFTRRSLAWGVLGLATGGRFFSLLTLLFSGALRLKTHRFAESFGDRQISKVFLSPLLREA
jgi:hypothetical protein